MAVKYAPFISIRTSHDLYGRLASRVLAPAGYVSGDGHREVWVRRCESNDPYFPSSAAWGNLKVANGFCTSTSRSTLPFGTLTFRVGGTVTGGTVGEAAQSQYANRSVSAALVYSNRNLCGYSRARRLACWTSTCCKLLVLILRPNREHLLRQVARRVDATAETISPSHMSANTHRDYSRKSNVLHAGNTLAIRLLSLPQPHSTQRMAFHVPLGHRVRTYARNMSMKGSPTCYLEER